MNRRQVGHQQPLAPSSGHSSSYIYRQPRHRWQQKHQ